MLRIHNSDSLCRNLCIAWPKPFSAAHLHLSTRAALWQTPSLKCGAARKISGAQTLRWRSSHANSFRVPSLGRFQKRRHLRRAPVHALLVGCGLAIASKTAMRRPFKSQALKSQGLLDPETPEFTTREGLHPIDGATSFPRKFWMGCQVAWRYG